MEIDRLAEFKHGLKDETDNTGPAVQTTQSKAMTEHTKLYEPIKQGLETIRKTIDKIEVLKDKEKTTVNTKDRQDIMKELDALMVNTSAVGKQIKNSLDKIKADNDRYQRDNENSATTQMRLNLYQTYIRKFHQVMNGYNQAAHDFRKALTDRTRRQLQIVDSNISPEQIEKILDSGQAEEFVGQALVSEDLDNVVREIEERHKGILRLEAQVMEIYQLFQDLATLVDIQQETLDVIENRIKTAKDFTENAVQDLKKGEEYQIKTRKRTCCILFLVLGILVAILAPILATVVKKA